MSWDYGKRSIRKLDTCHEELVNVFHLYRQKQFFEIAIIHGWRGEEIQHQAFIEGNSTKDWPDSKHNNMVDQKPVSHAVDYGPWCYVPKLGRKGIPWADTHAFAIIGGLLLACANELGYNNFIYGGDWDMDGLTTDQNLMDWGHLERY